MFLVANTFIIPIEMLIIINGEEPISMPIPGKSRIVQRKLNYPIRFLIVCITLLDIV